MIGAGLHFTGRYLLGFAGLPCSRRCQWGRSFAQFSLEKAPRAFRVASAGKAYMRAPAVAGRARSSSQIAEPLELRLNRVTLMRGRARRVAPIRAWPCAPAIKPERPPFDMQDPGPGVFMQRRQPQNSTPTRPAVASRTGRRRAEARRMPAGAASRERNGCERIERAPAATLRHTGRSSEDDFQVPPRSAQAEAEILLRRRLAAVADSLFRAICSPQQSARRNTILARDAPRRLPGAKPFAARRAGAFPTKL